MHRELCDWQELDINEYGTTGGQLQIITRDGGQYEFNQLFDLVAPQKEHKAAKQTEPSKAY